MKKCKNHPNKKAIAKGFCSVCYHKNKRATDPNFVERERARDRIRWANLPKERRLDKTYKTNYGMSYKEVVDLHNAQDKKCASCGDEVELGFEKGVVDHCHTSGKVRNILCTPCNKALGFVYDDISRLEKLIIYLRKHNDSTD